MTTLHLLELAEIAPIEVLGGAKTVRNREQLSQKVAAHARLRLAWCWILVALIVGICASGLGLAWNCPAAMGKGLLAFLGGPTLLALLAFGARAVKDYSEDRMTLLVLEHGSNAQVADYIEVLIDAKRRQASRSTTKRRGASAAG